MSNHTFETTVLGGLPVTIDYVICPAEPDVGLMDDYVDHWRITHVNGRKCKKSPDWITKQVLYEDIQNLCSNHYFHNYAHM